MKPTLIKRKPKLLPRVNKPEMLFPHITDYNDNKLCRFCKKKLTGRRRSWCSDECMNEALIICYPSFANAAVFKRDKGICSACGIDTVMLDRWFWKWIWNFKRLRNYEYVEWFQHMWRKLGYPIGRCYWEAHHIIPVREGGGGLGLDNYQTLCVICHKKETKLLRKRLSK